MPRFYLNQSLACGDVFRLPENIVRHITVLRLLDQQKVIFFNGDGDEYLATISIKSKKQIDALIDEKRTVQRESPLNIHLIQAVSQAERMDYTVQKSVELGVSFIQPILSERVTVRLSGERAQKRVHRWQEIVLSACEQCGRNAIPHVLPLMDLSAISSWLPESDNRFLLSPNSALPLKKVNKTSQNILLMVGAEGGFSPQEEDLIKQYGFQAVSLGPRILRTETAAIAAISAMQTLWGDF